GRFEPPRTEARDVAVLPELRQLAMAAWPSLERLPDLVAGVRPGVVNVEATTRDGLSTGSGFTIAVHRDDDAAGIVVTNHHVVASAPEIVIRFYDDTEHRASVRLLDPSTDLALLEL